ncbi:hypothetical protein [Chloracidobacterium thermophilum]|uniref:hypothetical protein n=1 Tax=Chloracidobacterium thermophilum TaxID=458033 RepID=UPI001300BB74|nr:hypothetical protein [Chloracidobacterium thermophilum]
MSQQRLPNMSDGKASGNAAGSGAEGDIVEIGNVLVCTNNDTIVIEKKYKPILKLLGCLLFPLFFFVSILHFQLDFSFFSSYFVHGFVCYYLSSYYQS